MTYPPDWRNASASTDIDAVLQRHPFAQLVSTNNGLRNTRVPFASDFADGQLTGLRAHLSGANPQAQGLDGAQVLVIFSGPHSYVSPNWRADKSRAGTFDYVEVRVRGTARLVDDECWFRQLIDDLSAMIEPQYAEVGNYPMWQTRDAPEGYIERLYPFITCFEIAVEQVEVIAKLHQQMPAADRASIADHLQRADRDDSRAIAQLIRAGLDSPPG